MRAAAKHEAAAIEKKISIMLDRIMESESKTVISRYESEGENLERQKFAMIEKTAKCGTVAKGYDEAFRTVLNFYQTLVIYGKMVRLRTSKLFSG